MSTKLTRNGIKALYLQPAPLFGGAERQAATMSALLPEFGVEVVPMVGPGNVLGDWLRERGVDQIVETRNFPGGWRKQAGFGRLTLPWRYFTCGLSAVSEITQKVEEEGIDIILASLPFAWITGSLVASRANIPIVWRAGGTDVNFVQETALWLVTRFQVPDLLLCNGEAVLDAFGPLVPAPSEIIRNGVDADLFHPGAGDPERYRPEGARHVVGYAARLTASKRPQDFIALAAMMKKRHPDTRFILAGDGSRRAEYERMASDLGADNLSFLGFVSDMPSFYAACDALVLPSRFEGCPNFMLEAMAMGKPVVAADIPPVTEIVRAHDAALLFKLGDVAELASRASTLLLDPNERVALGSRGLLCATEFTARASAAKIARSLRTLVAERAERRGRAPAVTRLEPQTLSGLGEVVAEPARTSSLSIPVRDRPSMD
jgi:glycosyltransferase involved in cell wall biosynthesis